MKKFFIIFILAALLSGCQKTMDDKYDSRNNVYTLDLYLDTEDSSLDVTGELAYKNDDFALQDLYLIIYPNASTPSEPDLNVEMEYLKIGGKDVAYEVAGTDDTAFHVDLESPLEKGERILITFSYSFHYWSTDRIADYGDYFLTMFFYPYVPLYAEGGWDIEPYSFRGETYANSLGDYYVSLDVPDTYLVATGGKLKTETAADTRKILEYELLDARDFSFSASDRYHVYTRTIEGVDSSIYSTRELFSSEIEASFTYLEDIFRVMDGEIGPYPYDHFTLEYGHFYGMESTGVIYCSIEIAEGTVVHEVVHQWFYSSVGNDQANESFLDESLTTYVVSFYYYEKYGLDGYNGYLDYRTSLKPEFADRYQANLGVTLLRQVDQYGDYYGFLIYYHGPAMFRYYVDRFLVGDIDRMQAILQKYFQEYDGKIATIDGFLELLEAESGVELTKEWFYLQLNEFQDFANLPA